MDFLEQNYKERCEKESDIYRHLPTLYQYACKVNHITEMGVGPGNSTAAFMHARPKKFITYDIVANSTVQELINKSREINLDFTYNVQSTLEVEIEPTDFLFIDSNHSYSHLKKELALHAGKVSTYLGFHDLEAYGLRDQDNHGSGSYNEQDPKGLLPAITEFLTEQSGQWSVEHFVLYNNGLLILKRNV